MHGDGDNHRAGVAVIRLIVTGGGLGLLPRAPGTWGSLGALPLTWVLHGLGGIWLVVLATGVIFAVGVWATSVYLGGGQDDPSEVVIDEIAGQMIALWPLSWGLTVAVVDPWLFPWPGWVGAFVMFRFFDIVKPPPINWLDRPGSWGVMLDDVAAGAIAAIVVLIAAGVAHGGI